MAVSRSGKDESWSGRAAFILAAVGSAVGIGNLVRFPYVAGESGGGLFVIAYLLAVFAIGLPVLMAELFIGRRGGGTPIAAIVRLAKADGASPAWGIMGWIGMLASFGIVTFYSVIAGWLLYYAWVMVGDIAGNIGASGLAGLAAPAFASVGDSTEITGIFGELLSNPGKMILFHGIFIAVSTIIVTRGVKGGIEKAATWLMPVFFFLLVALAVISLTVGDAGAALAFLFQPDFQALARDIADGSILVNAVGQAFFSLSLGSVLMLTYGIYLSRETSIPGAATTVAFADTGVAMIAGLAVFPVVFQFGLEPAGGLGLIFGPLLLAFNQMPFGALFGLAFFIMAVFAALTSAISLFEVPAAWAKGDITLDEATRNKRRLIGTILIGLAIFVIGVFHALSQVPVEAGDNFFNTWQPFGTLPVIGDRTLLDAIDGLTGNVLLPLGGFLAAVFAGYVVTQSASREELGFKQEKHYQRWRFLIRYVCPAVVGLILVYGIAIAPFLN
ncbi:sodium-dependent transporter [Parvularcula sp. ZS-1/3]|uniref:Sodium-dependent transporter n=1 Tax=Parvularcula mediterranea TaxID=2732508 RepID=A0A7Y3RN66_9PROT|nr:sodium-dependent transporter [Parvularcula mediterranea]NNU17146.1 sodium-dependent transporter [Parvularcula mediterranea]